MKPTAESRGACLPVTSLQTILTRHGALLLSGQGSHLVIRDVSSGRVLLKQRIFDCQSVHGILHLATNEHLDHDEQGFVEQILIYGGSDIVWGRLDISYMNDELEAIDSRRMKFQEVRHLRLDKWIFSAVLEKPCTGSDRYTSLLTSQDTLIRLVLHPSCKLSESRLEVLEHITGPDTFLYTGHIINEDSNTLLIAAGTVFGEIIVWQCRWTCHSSEPTISVLHTYTGHMGSVFGVALSEPLTKSGPRLLASCSDDRSIRIWLVPTESTTVEQSSKISISTGFSGGIGDWADKLQLGWTWGHSSRIWGVQFLPGRDDGNYRLISRGEDGVCQLWKVTLNGAHETGAWASCSITPVKHDRHHAGKNIWSVTCTTQEDIHSIYTGGADGQIVSRNFDATQAELLESTSKSFRALFDSMGLALQPSHVPVGSKPAAKALRQYLILDGGTFLATTNTGTLFKCSGTMTQPESWTEIYSADSTAPLYLCNNHAAGVTLIADPDGSILLYRSSTNELQPLLPTRVTTVTYMQICAHYKCSEVQHVYVALSSKESRNLIILRLALTNTTIETSRVEFELPPSFLVTAACLEIEKEILVLGSRAGALVSYYMPSWSTNTTEPAHCLRHAHGSDTVTSIRNLPRSQDNGIAASVSSSHHAYFLTTGRDGTCAVHVFDCKQSSDLAAQIGIAAVHILTPPLGPYIEGTCQIPSTNGSLHDTVLYGFRSKEFVVWNESTQVLLLSVDCGGAHRSWNLHYRITDGGSVLWRFMWTRAGTLNTFLKQFDNHKILEAGGHGREIKAIAKRGAKPMHKSLIHQQTIEYVATGAEDTTIRIFAVKLDEDMGKTGVRPFRCLVVLRQHTTGIQHLQFSENGDFLFSSGGCEEFCVWRFTTDVPEFVVGTVLQDTLPKEADSSDARIMDFSAFEIAASRASEPRPMYQIAMAYSNGKLKVFRYTVKDRGHGEFELLHEYDRGAICLTQVSMLDVRSQSGACSLMTAATNGTISTSRYDGSKRVDAEIHDVHQNCITTSTEAYLEDAMRLIVTGGDDNAVAFTLMSGFADKENETSTTKSRFRTVLVSKAHAAAVRAVEILRTDSNPEYYQVLVLSAGNDQKIKLWALRIQRKGIGFAAEETNTNIDEVSKSVAIHKYREINSDIADISDLVVLQNPRPRRFHGQQAEWDVMVVGIGMEILKLSYAEEAPN